jgi:selenocysteine-specific translation elongation factor
MKEMTEDKIKFVCENCGKTVLIRKVVFEKKQKLLCRACSIQDTKQNYSEDQKKKISEKRVETCMKKYGTTNGGASEQAKQKQKETMIKNYGSVKDGYKHHQEKREQTLLNQYGVKNNAQRESAKESTRKTLVSRYGSVKEAYKERTEVIQKVMMEKYGVTTNLAFVTFKKYGYDNNFFDSSWELAYYIWLKDHKIKFSYHEKMIKYIGDDDKEHCYYPDFIIDNKIVEIKGDHFFNEKEEPYDKYHKCFWKNKHDLILKQGGKILRSKDIKPYIEYVKDKYGKNFLKSCKLK